MRVHVAQQIGEKRELIDDFNLFAGELEIVQDPRAAPPNPAAAFKFPGVWLCRWFVPLLHLKNILPEYGGLRAIRGGLPENAARVQHLHQPAQVRDHQDKQRRQDCQAAHPTGHFSIAAQASQQIV